MRRLLSMAAGAARRVVLLAAAIALFAAAEALVVLPAGVALAEVAVVEEEVVFTIKAPPGSSVYLAGDFNNWNPTLEMMNEVNGRYEVRLFLVPGSYRYKFVVDGKWISDPDNPGADPAKGSPLELRERAGMLVLGAAEESEKEIEEKLRPSARYSGAFFAEDSETRSDQALDLWLAYRGKNVDAQVDFKTTEDSWDTSPLRAEVLFDRGHIDLRVGRRRREGVRERLDVGVVGSVSSLRRTSACTDTTRDSSGGGSRSKRPRSSRPRFAVCTATSSARAPVRPRRSNRRRSARSRSPDAPDTVIYRYEDAYEDEDTWGFDLSADAGSLDFGYARRWNRGFHPGAFAEVTKRETDFDVAFYTTREFWDGDTGWLRWGFLDGFGATVGFGRATAVIRTNDASSSTIDGAEDLSIGAAARASDIELPLQKSGRWTGGLDLAKDGWRANAVYSWAEYEFESGVYSSSKARVGELSIDASYEEPKWSAKASLRAVDQDYGSTPADFHAATPRRNFWLDTRDRLTVADMVSFDLDRCVHMNVAVSSGEKGLFRTSAAVMRARRVGSPRRRGRDDERVLRRARVRVSARGVRVRFPPGVLRSARFAGGAVSEVVVGSHRLLLRDVHRVRVPEPSGRRRAWVLASIPWCSTPW